MPLFLALEGLALSSRTSDWSIEWQWATSWMNGILVLLGPLTAGVAAAETVHFRRHSSALSLSVPPSKVIVSQALRVLGVTWWAAVAHVLGMVAAAIVVGVRHGEPGWLEVRLIPPALLLLLAFAAIGALLAWCLPYVVTPAVVAVAGYFVPGAQLAPPSWFLAGGATGPLVGLQYRPDLLWAQSLLWLSCFVAAIVSVAAFARPRAQSLLGAIVGVGLVAVAASWVSSFGPDALTERPVGALACNSGEPPVCSPQEYAEVIAEVDAIARPVVGQLTNALGGLGVSRLVVFAPPPLPRGVVAVQTRIGPPYTDSYNVAVSVVGAATACPPGHPGLDGDVAAIVGGAIPELGGGGLEPGTRSLTPAEARERFEAVRAQCAG